MHKIEKSKIQEVQSGIQEVDCHNDDNQFTYQQLCSYEYFGIKAS